MQKKGFTLTEVVIAMLILATATAGIFASFVAGGRFTSRSKRRLAAINFARAKAEELKASVRQDTFNNPNPNINELSLGNHGPFSAPTDSPLTGAFNGVLNYEVSEIPIGVPPNVIPVRKVVFTVSWDEPSS